MACLVGLALAALFSHGVARQSRLNDDPYAGDQSEYLAYAQALAVHPDLAVQDRAQMPLFPLLLTATTDVGDASGDTVSLHEFEQAKSVGTLLALAALAAVGLWTWRRAGTAAAAFAVTFTAFGLVMFKAPWAQTDVLFYVFISLTLAAMVRALRRPGLVPGAVVGLLGGFTMLAKPSASPALVAFVLVATLGALSSWRRRGDGPGPAAFAATILGAAVLFAAVLSPYAATSDRFYGSPTYNRNSTYYLWYDSWAEVKAEAQQGNDNIGPLDLPPDEMPTMRNYLRDHDAGDIFEREWNGLGIQAGNVFDMGWGIPLLALAASLIGCAAWERERLRGALRRELLPATFGVVAVAIYLAGWAWWTPIDPSPRFVMTLFVPGVTLAIVTVVRTLRPHVVRVRSREGNAATVWLAGFSLLLVPFIVRASLHLSGTLDGGI
ncbi:MAG: hypothetical protein JWM47_2023 [Acidimicrobiales bacterium]|nr:hypothetical protein [Acidimicrobiales bacterium]